MVLQVFADAFQLVTNGNASRFQHVAGPDPGELKNLRRTDSACGQDHLAPGGRTARHTAAPELDPCGAPAVESQAFDHCASYDGEVRPRPHRSQERFRRGPSQTRALVDLKVARTLVVTPVKICNAGDPRLLSGIGPCIENA